MTSFFGKLARKLPGQARTDDIRPTGAMQAQEAADKFSRGQGEGLKKIMPAQELQQVRPKAYASEVRDLTLAGDQYFHDKAMPQARHCYAVAHERYAQEPLPCIKLIVLHEKLDEKHQADGYRRRLVAILPGVLPRILAWFNLYYDRTVEPSHTLLRLGIPEILSLSGAADLSQTERIALVRALSAQGARCALRLAAQFERVGDVTALLDFGQGAWDASNDLGQALRFATAHGLFAVAGPLVEHGARSVDEDVAERLAQLALTAPGTRLLEAWLQTVDANTVTLVRDGKRLSVLQYVLGSSNNVLAKVELLLKHPVDVLSRPDPSTPLPLHMALERGAGYLEVVTQGAGIDLNAADPATGDTVLHAAAQNKQRASILALLLRGADAQRQNHVGLTPTAVAAAQGADSCYATFQLAETLIPEIVSWQSQDYAAHKFVRAVAELQGDAETRLVDCVITWRTTMAPGLLHGDAWHAETMLPVLVAAAGRGMQPEAVAALARLCQHTTSPHWCASLAKELVRQFGQDVTQLDKWLSGAAFAAARQNGSFEKVVSTALLIRSGHAMQHLVAFTKLNALPWQGYDKPCYWSVMWDLVLLSKNGGNIDSLVEWAQADAQRLFVSQSPQARAKRLEAFLQAAHYRFGAANRAPGTENVPEAPHKQQQGGVPSALLRATGSDYNHLDRDCIATEPLDKVTLAFVADAQAALAAAQVGEDVVDQGVALWHRILLDRLLGRALVLRIFEGVEPRLTEALVVRRRFHPDKLAEESKETGAQCSALLNTVMELLRDPQYYLAVRRCKERRA